MRRLKTTIAAVLLLAAAGAPARAQFAEKKALTLEGAKKVIAAAAAEARAHEGTSVIAVVDDGGNLMAVERLDGTFAAGGPISIGKARTAVLFKRPTKAFEDIINNGRTAMVTVEGFTPLQGGVPILVDGQVVGGVGVSGAASAQRDEEVAMAGAAALAGGMTAAADVTFIGGDQVSAAFAKGQPLLETDLYKVHASRRDAAGIAEVHVRDTDIVYVLKGTATLVTGGTVVDGKTVAPDEIRGASIQGGTSRKLAPGDVVIVPNGVPHWFQKVEAPFTYYVVKATR